MLQRIILLGLAALFWVTTGAAAAGETLSVPGTGDSQTLLAVLAKSFAETHPGLQVDIPASVGTIGGIKRVLAGETPLARSARPLSTQEQQRGLQQLVFAYSPIVFVANLHQPCLDNLSAAQIVGIYSGRLTSWIQLGNCPNKKIYVANREDGDSSRRVLVEQVPGFAGIDTFAGEILYSNPENQRIIEQYPQTIGYMPLANKINSPLHALRYEGVAATVAAVQKGEYPLTVPLGVVWKGELQGPAKVFVDFLLSPTGKKIIEQNGAVPVALMPRASQPN